MFKLYATSVFLTFLASISYSYVIPQNHLSTFQSSDALVTVFTSIGSLILPGEYTQELKIAPDTCSIRIDFNTFTFDQPIKTPKTPSYVCGPKLNVLKLEAIGPLAINIPDLCGELSGQQIYLPTKNYKETILNATGLDALNLTVVYLGLHTLRSQKPLWNITLTQLPCQSEKDVELSQLSDSLPPIECLQYFTESERTIENFNLGYNLGNLNYTTCLKLYPDTCGIKTQFLKTAKPTWIDLIPTSFNLNTLFSPPSIEQICDTLNLRDYVGMAREYLILPDGVTVNGDSMVIPSKYCGINKPMTYDVNVTGSGPHYIGTTMTGLPDMPYLDEGFKIYYKLLKNCQ